MLVLDKKDVWDDFLDTCTYAYNTLIHDSTAFTPFEVMFSRKAFLPIDIEIDNKSPEELLDHLSKEKDDIQAVQAITNPRLEKLQVAENNIKKAQEKQKEIFDRKHARPNAFAVEGKVLMKDMRRKKRAGGKMDEHYIVPYVITKHYGKGIYSLQGVDDPGEIIPRVNGAQLKPYIDQPDEYVSLVNIVYCYIL